MNRQTHLRLPPAARCLFAAVSVTVIAVACRKGGDVDEEEPPANEPAPAATLGIHFVDRAADLGIRHRHTDGSSGMYFIVETLASGVAMFDHDNDGRLDLYFPSGRALGRDGVAAGDGNAFYRQNALGKFDDLTADAGLGGNGYGIGCCVGDYDGDTDLDLYVTQFGANALYRNNGNGTFTELAAAAGVDEPRLGTGAVFFDFDSDGDLDLYVANYCALDLATDEPCLNNNVQRYCPPETFAAVPDTLYRNEGGGRFTDVSEASGIRAPKPGRGLGVIATDFNGDGVLDLFVANDATENFLFLNQGDGTFKESALLHGVALDMNGDEQGCMGVDVADIDLDGRPELVVTNYQKQANALYSMKGDGYYTDVALSSGVAADSLPWVGWGTGFFDADHDGLQDLFIANGHLEDQIERYDQSSQYKQPNQLLRNVGGGRLANISDQAGPGLAAVRSSRGAAFGDLDNDGDIDIVVCESRESPSVLMNESDGGGHWIGLDLRGAGGAHLVNARAEVHIGDRVLRREARSGGSYVSQNDLRLHFGLGAAEAIDKVTVYWPDGGEQSLADLPVDRYHTITRGAD